MPHIAFLVRINSQQGMRGNVSQIVGGAEDHPTPNLSLDTGVHLQRTRAAIVWCEQPQGEADLRPNETSEAKLGFAALRSNGFSDWYCC